MCFIIIAIDWTMDSAKFTIIISFLKNAFIGQLAVHIVSVGNWAFNFGWFADSWANRVVGACCIVHSLCGWNTFLWL